MIVALVKKAQQLTTGLVPRLMRLPDISDKSKDPFLNCFILILSPDDFLFYLSFADSLKFYSVESDQTTAQPLTPLRVHNTLKGVKGVMG